MASLLQLTHSLSLFLNSPNPTIHFLKSPKFVSLPTKASVEANGAIETPKPSRRGRKKKPTSPETKTKRTRKTEEEDEEEELYDFDDGMDFPYDDPPLICCFGAAQKEFVPTVRVNDEPMHPDKYSTWKMLQWDPPEFSRAPGGPPSNVAISHVRLGGRAAFMGKIGGDEFGEELVLMMNKERVQTRGVKIDGDFKTGCSYMKVKFDENGKLKMETCRGVFEASRLFGF